MANLAATQTSISPDWNTPKCVLDLVDRVLDGIGLDPCSNEESVVGAAFGMTLRSANGGGLGAEWSHYETAFVNPPYGREIGKWTAKIVKESATGIEIIALLPARPDARWFQDVWTAQAICFWRGRIRFLGAKASAPFPSVVAYWGPQRFKFASVFESVGHVVMP